MLDTYIYIIYSEYTSTIKVGYSKNPDARLSSLQTGCPHRLNLYAMFLGSLEDEQELHKLLHHYRQDGEWFILCLESMAIISQFQLLKANEMFNLKVDPHVEFKQLVEQNCKNYLARYKTKKKTKIPLKFLRDLCSELPDITPNSIRLVMAELGYQETKNNARSVFFSKVGE